MLALIQSTRSNQIACGKVCYTEFRFVFIGENDKTFCAPTRFHHIGIEQRGGASATLIYSEEALDRLGEGVANQHRIGLCAGYVI